MPYRHKVQEKLKQLIDKGKIEEFKREFQSIKDEDPKLADEYLLGVKDEGRGVLSWASMQAGCEELIPYLIEAGTGLKEPYVNHQDEKGRTALLLAVDRGCVGNARALLAAKADPNISETHTGDTPLHIAASGSNNATALIELLCNNGAELQQNEQGETPFHKAAKHSLEAMQALIAHRKIDVNAPGNDGDTPLHYAATSETNGANATYLLRLGVDSTILNADGETAAQVANKWDPAGMDWKAIVEFNSEKAGDPVAYKQTAYMQGIELYEQGSYKKAKDFFEKAARYPDPVDPVVQLKASYYLGQCYYALKQYPSATKYFGHVVIYSQTLKLAGNDITDLVDSAHHYKANTLYALKKYDAAIKDFERVPDKHELSMCANLYKGFCHEKKKQPDYISAEQSFKKVMKLYSGSKYYDKDNISNVAKKSLISNLINQEKYDELFADEFLQFNEVNFDLPDDTGNTLLMYATTYKKPAFVAQLITKGANPFHPNKYGDSPFSMAMDSNNADLIQIFKNKIESLNRADFGSIRDIVEDLLTHPENCNIEHNDISHIKMIFEKYDLDILGDVQS